MNNVKATTKWHKDHNHLSHDGIMDSLQAGRYVGWTLLMVGGIGLVLTSSPMPSGPAFAAHPTLRGQYQIEQLVRMASIALSLVGILFAVGTSFMR